MLHFFGILGLLGHAGGQRISVPQGLPPAVAVDVFNHGSCAYAAWPPSDLASYGTRHTCSSQTDPNRGIGAARDWIERMNVSVEGYLQEVNERFPFPTQTSNVIARLEGSSDPSRVYVVSGHYGSRVTDIDNYTDDAPSANDDASRVVLVMELAREEQGLYGAGYLAQTLRNASVNADLRDPNSIRVFAQGLPLAEDETQRAQRLTAGGGNDSPARQLARFIAEVGANDATDMKVAIIHRLDRFPRGGDHRPFLEQGYSAVRFTEPNEIFAHQHQDNPIGNGQQFGDLPEFLDYEFGKRVAKVNMVALWSLAQAPGTVRNLTNNTSILGNNSTFSWLPTNAPLWARVVDVGNVNTATVALSKDSVIFGVRSVGRNGHKSPALFPCPTVA
ncbi:putative zinc metalloprotease [Phyllosticta citricarpa]|uniref:Peptide hydrolase n=1 Tax=Phyllosticta citricarpa TaxID=55181 RepID=A0ABR1MGI6_9PEZI